MNLQIDFQSVQFSLLMEQCEREMGYGLVEFKDMHIKKNEQRESTKNATDGKFTIDRYGNKDLLQLMPVLQLLPSPLSSADYAIGSHLILQKELSRWKSEIDVSSCFYPLEDD